MVSRESVVIAILRLSVPVGLVLVALAFGVTTERLDAFASSPLPLVPMAVCHPRRHPSPSKSSGARRRASRR